MRAQTRVIIIIQQNIEHKKKWMLVLWKLFICIAYRIVYILNIDHIYDYKITVSYKNMNTQHYRS